MLVGERRDLLMARLRRDGKLVAHDIAHEFSLSKRASAEMFESWLPPGFANGSMGEPSHCAVHGPFHDAVCVGVGEQA